MELARAEDPELRERWLRTAETETIGPFLYGQWKDQTPQPAQTPRLSFRFGLLLLVITTVIALLARIVYLQTLAGNFAALRIFGAGFILLTYGVPIAVLAIQRLRQTKKAQATELPPPGFPKHAVAALASSTGRGRSTGWLWFENEDLVFQGTDFDFRLKRTDFKSKRPLFPWLKKRGQALLNHPTGISNHGLILNLGIFADGEFQPSPQTWNDLKPEFDQWESASPANQAQSIFPPVRSRPTIPFRLSTMQWVGPALFMSTALLILGAIVPLQNQKPALLLPIGFVFGGLWNFVIWSDASAKASATGQADKVARKLAKHLPTKTPPGN